MIKVSWFKQSELLFHLLKLDSKQNLNVLHNALAKRSSFTCRITVTGYWERLGVVQLLRSCVNPLEVPDNPTAASLTSRKKKNPGKFQWRRKTQLCRNRGWHHWRIPTRRQAGSSAGNLSKYIYVLFSPQRHLWSTVSFSETSIQFMLPPNIKFPWNNHGLI